MHAGIDGNPLTKVSTTERMNGARGGRARPTSGCTCTERTCPPRAVCKMTEWLSATGSRGVVNGRQRTRFLWIDRRIDHSVS